VPTERAVNPRVIDKIKKCFQGKGLQGKGLDAVKVYTEA
jgi:hypothetical protein